MFFKNDLKTGMIVEFNNKERGLFLFNGFIGSLGERKALDLKHYTDDLICVGYDEMYDYNNIAHSINKIFKSNINFACDIGTLLQYGLELLWERG